MNKLDADWLHTPEVNAITRLIDPIYFVGGCVRDSLLGLEVRDIDLATPLQPTEVQSTLEAAGVQVVPTGIAHGTVTAISNGRPLEITTFRRDVATDGRRATVAFTSVLAEDAARRDFTMNALYVDPEGQIIDPIDGYADLKAGHVRFIGKPGDRICEDYLRVLRFFRFNAWFEKRGIDQDGLAACAEHAEGIETLSRERIGGEMRRLLAAPDPAPAMASMAACGALIRALPGADATLLAPVVAAEETLGIAPDWRRRLAALSGENPERALRLSRAEDRFLSSVRKTLEHASSPAERAYRFGQDAALAAILIEHASLGQHPAASLLQAVKMGSEATFPVSAHDLLNAGQSPGPHLGSLLQVLEESWISSDFHKTKQELMLEL